MKTKRNLFLCAALALVLLASLFGIGRSHYGAVNAEENTEEVFVKISSTNLSFDDNIYIYFRAYYDGIDVSDASSDNYGMIFWKTEVAEEERTFENAQTLAASGSAIIIEKCDDWQNLPINTQGDKKDVATYKYKVAAKEMADVIYAEPYALKGGVYYYGKTIEYSVAAYASRRLGFYHGVAGSTNENFINLLNAMVNYGTLAQKYFNYNVDNLMSDVVSAGKHATLTHIEALAPTCTEAGHAEYWQCECGQLFADADGKTTLDAIPTLDPLGHDLVTDTCTHCTRCNYRKPSDGLVYTLNADGASYSVTGIGTATDTFIVIAPEYNSLPVTAIRQYTFQNKSQVIGIELPNSITDIGTYAFNNCRLEEIDFKGDLLQWLNLNVDNYSDFYLYTSGVIRINNKILTNIVIPDTITKIRDYAFYNYNKLINLTIPDNITIVGEKAFASCVNLTNISLGRGIERLVGYTFSSCTSLENIVIPDNIIQMDDTFSSCTNLRNVSLGNGLKSLYGTFVGCTALTSITIPKNVSSIWGSAFYKCYNLYEVVNKSDLKISLSSSDNGYVAYYAKILINKDGSQTTSQDYYIKQGDFLFESSNNNNKLIAYLGSEDIVTLPLDFNGEAYTIGGMRGVKRVIVPDTITKINDYAFSGCNTLTSIIIPDSVTEIGTGAFYDCKNLLNISLGFGITSIGNEAFYCCENLKRITIPYNVKSIGKSAFLSCKSLTNISIPDNVRSIEAGTFSSCSNLRSITIGKNTTNIATGAFSSCDIEEITVSISNSKYASVNNCLIDQTAKTIILGCKNSIIPTDGSATKIGDYAFNGCTSLKAINISNTITEVGLHAFDYCIELEKITISENVTNIKDYAFDGCKNLKYINYIGTLSSWLKIEFGYKSNLLVNAQILEINGNKIESLVIPNNITEIKKYAFYGYKGLTDIYIPQSVTCIQSDAFYDCTNIVNVYYDGDLSSWCLLDIWDTAASPLRYASCFYIANKEIQELIIPDDITEIKANTFFGYKGLKSLTIGENITQISNYAFAFCQNLENLTFSEGLTTINSSAFNGCSKLLSIKIPDSVETIGYYAFDSCSALTEVYIGKKLTKLQSQVFENCNNLESVIWNAENCTLIGSNIFNGCSNIDSIVIGDSVQIIPDKLFSNCNALKSIIIPDNVTTIGTSAFNGCYNVTDLKLGKSISIIKSYAFGVCNRLARIDFDGTMSEWKAITKGSGWNSGTGDYTVYCTDGKLDKNDKPITD